MSYWMSKGEKRLMKVDEPLEVLVNNTKWDGRRSDGSTRSDFTPVSLNGITNYISEVPNEGDTELWEILNLTADAHPIHTHLTQFQRAAFLEKMERVVPWRELCALVEASTIRRRATVGLR